MLDGSGFGIALRDDDAAQRVAKLTGHFLIGGLAIVVAKTDLRIRLGWLQENTPAVIRHLHEFKIGPAFGLDADGGAQVNVFLLESVRTHFTPPVKIVRQPLFQSALELLVFGKVYVVWNSVVKIHDSHRFQPRINADARGGKCISICVYPRSSAAKSF